MKDSLRRALRVQRAAIPASARRNAALRALKWARRIAPLRRARHVALYLAAGSELSTAPLLARLLRRHVHVYLPRLARDGMRFICIRRHTPLRRNRHGIREPLRGTVRAPRRLDVIVVPVVGFDRHGTRLGAGGGHYDRTLAFPRTYRRPLRLGYAYASQYRDELPREAWDLRLDGVITDQGVWQWRTG